MDVANIKHQLIVSCQALETEPLHSPFIMGRMALAAQQGGAKGIRANTVVDILEIKNTVDLPVIGIIKKVYGDNPVFITPTFEEVKALAEINCDIIALDATSRVRPDGVSLKDLVDRIRKEFPNQKIMADCATLEEAIYADEIGFDFIGTTLIGYTKESEDLKVEQNDFEIIKAILNAVKHPVIAEGNIDSPEKVKRVLELGCYSVVVGSAITRPQLITKKFTDAIKEM